LTRNGTDADSAFLALNLAFLQDGAVVRLPAGCVLPEPIRIVSLNRAAEPGQNVHARHLILADQGSEATVLEHHAGLAGAPGLTNTATDVVADEGARLEYVKLQDEPAAAFHVGSLRVWAGKGSSVLCHSFALGARLARQDIVGSLAGEGGEAVFNGLYLGHDERLLDHHLTVEHVQPAGVSHEYFNGILADGSQGVFFGRIRVHPRAQKTDAKQTNKNLLLSDRASIHTRPQLEIHADDVKCTHGATIGQLSPEAIFYLRARGVPLATARRMLIHAFAGEIIDRVRCTPARDALDRLVWDRLERDQHVSAAP
jgi:Fe-S cluster assembly protein SufD